MASVDHNHEGAHEQPGGVEGMLSFIHNMRHFRLRFNKDLARQFFQLEPTTPRNQIKNFCKTTSAHGLNRIAGASHICAGITWTLLFLACLSAFSFQAYLTVQKFQRNEKIVNVHLNSFDFAMKESKVLRGDKPPPPDEEGDPQNIDPRKRRSLDVKTENHSDIGSIDVNLLDYITIMQIQSVTCTCASKKGYKCAAPPLQHVLQTVSQCMCIFNRLTGSYWACEPENRWRLQLCRYCTATSGLCELPRLGQPGSTQCWCNRDKGLCVVSEPKESRAALRQKRQTPQQTVAALKEKELKTTFVGCQCRDDKSCRPLTAAPETLKNVTTCLCFYNTAVAFTMRLRVLWPCFPKEDWHPRNCSSCHPSGSCDYVPKGFDLLVKIKDPSPCVCIDALGMCVHERKTRETSSEEEHDTINGDPETKFTSDMLKVFAVIVKSKIPDPTPTNSTILDFVNTNDSVIPTETSEVLYEKAQGFTGMKDTVAISTKAKENLVYAVGGLLKSEKKSISYSRDEMIIKCSFSGEECAVEEDFKLYVDPTFGNCYTFNSEEGKRTVTGSQRAGPAYGLRVQVYINTTDYLPTTESSGVRIAIHPQNEVPFPDTTGFSAPTGFISSFGIYLGCHRSCLQRYIVSQCGCSDPRFPKAFGSSTCPSDNPYSRNCVEKAIAWVGGLHGLEALNCHCRQPCRNEAAMVEIFFEELNYQHLLETEAYGWSNLLADFGGQLGLWMGVSVITCIEFMLFVWEVMSVCLITRMPCCRKFRNNKNGSDQPPHPNHPQMLRRQRAQFLNENLVQITVDLSHLLRLLNRRMPAQVQPMDRRPNEDEKKILEIYEMQKAIQKSTTKPN